jgi:putative transposase
MLQNQRLSRSIADMGFYELRRQLEYKTTQRQTKLVIANRYFPSTKMCSKCKTIKEDLGLSLREWKCVKCGCLHDRDLNAAINLENYAVSSTVKACGGISSGYMSDLYNATVPMKQEVNTNSYL